MNYICIKTKEYPVPPEEFRRRFPGSPYPMLPSQLFRYGYAEVHETTPPIAGEYETAIESFPEHTMGMVWRQKWELVDYFTANEQAEKEIIERTATNRKESVALATMRDARFKKNVAKALNIKL